MLIAGLLMPFSVIPGTPSDAAHLRMLEGQSVFSKYFLAPWYRWDSVHYTDIAENGYSNKAETYWPPLYPLLTRAVASVFSPTLLASLIVSNLAAIAALALLYIVVQDTWDEKIARSTLLILTVFPTAFFLVAAYTESLFLIFSLGCLYAYKKSKWAAAAVLGAAAILTRWQGVILIVPMAWIVLSDLLVHREQRLGQLARRAVPGAVILLTLLGYSILIRYQTGADWPWQTLVTYWPQHTGWPWEGLLGNFTSLTFNPPVAFYPPFSRIFDLILSCAAIVLLVWARKKIPVYYMVYAVSQLLLILTRVDNQNLLISCARLLLVIFPVMIAAALTLNNTIRRIWIPISIASQAVLLVLFYWWIWVA